MNLTSTPVNFDDRLMICDCDGVLIDSERLAVKLKASAGPSWPLEAVP